jgi:Rha family phage regulatory protein
MDNFLDIYGVTEKKGVPVVGSRRMAEIFHKRHDNVLQQITDLKNKVSEEFGLLNFQESSYKNEQNKKQPEYLLTRDGFTILAMGFTGTKAVQFKEAYINRFNEMELFIKSLSQAKLEHPAWTEAIMLVHSEPKHWHFSNEANLINRIVLGCDAKQIKLQRNIPEDAPSIRPFLSLHEIKGIEYLQRIDIGLLYANLDYESRKQILNNRFLLMSQKTIKVS